MNQCKLTWQKTWYETENNNCMDVNDITVLEDQSSVKNYH